MLIGITGKLESGKTTIANFIEKIYPDENVIKLAFADPLKEMIYKAGICKEEELWGKKTKFSRLMLQKIGTDIFRNQIDENFWVNEIAMKIIDINDQYDKNCIIVIHDVRFLSEANCIKSFNGKIIRVIRSEDTKNDYDKFKKYICSFFDKNDKNKHVSETEMDQIKEDYLIGNNKDLFSLFDITEKYMKMIIEDKVKGI